MNNDLTFLLQDPRYDLPADSHLWRQLFRRIPLLEDRQAAMVLSPRLWHLRAWGTEIKRTHVRTEFVPVIDREMGWDSQEEFAEAKNKYLRPYANQIYQLLSALE